MGVTRAQSVFLPIWQDEFQSDYKSVSSLYSFGFGGSMLNCILGQGHYNRYHRCRRQKLMLVTPQLSPNNHLTLANSTNNTQKIWIT